MNRPVDGPPAESLPDCVVQTDLELRFEAVGAAAREILGIPADALVGTPLADLVTPDDLGRLQDLVRDALGGSDRTASHLITTRVRHADGHLVPLEIHGRLFLGEDGEPAGFVGIARDVTVRERRLAESRDRERQRLQQQKHEAVARLAGAVARDLASLAARWSSPEAREHAPAQLAPAIARLRALAGQAATTRDRDLDETVGQIVAAWSEASGEDADVRVEPGSGGAVAPLDEDALAMALEALLENARRAAGTDGEIVVRTGVRVGAGDHDVLPATGPRPMVTVSVEDRGEGMSRATLERATEPYFTTRREAPGLGLAHVRAVAAAHGGCLELRSEAGEGTRATLVLPARFAATDAPVSPARDAAGRPAVLVVDDDPEILRYVGRVLRGAGLRVIPCADGMEALAQLASGETLDAVVLDWALPGLDGRRVREQILRRQPRIPLLIISAHARDEYAPLGSIDTQTPWLVKPFTPGELTRAVRSLLRQGAAGSGS
jgi:PAS domain S-box-containing protein